MSAEIIIPVYNAAADLARCLAAVEATVPAETRVTLIDDASTDDDIRQQFRALAKRSERRWQLLRNPRNLGFVRTVNRAMAASHGDVILLNSDTIPAGRWYERLNACAASDERIATATPFSNNAEICSFPAFCRNNPPPADPELVARAVAEAGPPDYPDLPTGVGFCLFIRGGALRQLGLFDTRFGHGYGEENDFCMRARAAGWRNVLCDDAYVVHLGGRSFSEFGLEPKTDDAMARIRARYPDYEALVAEFVQTDPLAGRRDLIRERLETLDDGRQGPSW